MTKNPNFHLLSLQPSHLNPNLRLQSDLHLQPVLILLQIRTQRARRRRIQIPGAAARHGGLERGGVLGSVDERRKSPVADVDAGAGDGDGDGVVEEDELLVGVPGGDGEV